MVWYDNVHVFCSEASPVYDSPKSHQLFMPKSFFTSVSNICMKKACILLPPLTPVLCCFFSSSKMSQRHNQLYLLHLCLFHRHHSCTLFKLSQFAILTSAQFTATTNPFWGCVWFQNGLYYIITYYIILMLHCKICLSSAFVLHLPRGRTLIIITYIHNDNEFISYAMCVL